MNIATCGIFLIVGFYNHVNGFKGTFNRVHFSFWINTTQTDVTSGSHAVPNISIQACIVYCKNSTVCAYINYVQRTKTCFIVHNFYNALDYVVEKNSGYVYGNKSEWVQSPIKASCPHSQCICDVTINGTQTNYCAPPPIQNFTTMYGNMYAVDSLHLYQCDLATYIGLTPLQQNIRCHSNCSWTDLTLICLESTTTSTTTTTTTTTTATTTTLPSTTTTTTTTLPPLVPFSCPSFTDQFITVTLTDYTPFTFRAVRSSKTQSQAISACASLSGRLVQVLTAAKMEYILQLLQCNGFKGGSYWFDGKRKSSDNYRQASSWKTSDGYQLPFSDFYWGSGYPNNGNGNEYCIRFAKNLGFEWDDESCSNNFYYICEQ